MGPETQLQEIGVKSIPPDDQILILELYKRYRLVPNEDGTKPTIPQTCRKVSSKVEYPPDVVYRVVQKLRQSPAEAATQYFRARAVKMAKKVVNRANPSELIDVLSRSNIGVLAPKKEGGADGGFFLTVNAQDCGAVKVGIQQVVGPAAEEQPLLTDGGPDMIEAELLGAHPEPEAVGDVQEEMTVHGPKQVGGNARTFEQGRPTTSFGHRLQNPQIQAALSAARNRLAPGKRRRKRERPYGSAKQEKEQSLNAGQKAKPR